MVLIQEHVRQNQRTEQGSLYRSLQRWAQIQPGATYIVEAETGYQLSYAQMLAAVQAVCQTLGDGPRRLALALPGGIVNATLWLSALGGGYHLLPVASNATDEEKAAMARRHQPDVLIVEQEEDARGFGLPRAMVLTRQACEMLIEQTPLAPSLEAREGYAYLTTSGSTGEPKGVVLSRAPGRVDRRAGAPEPQSRAF